MSLDSIHIEFMDDGSVTYRIHRKDKKKKGGGIEYQEPITGTAKNMEEVIKEVKGMNKNKELKDFFGI